MRRKREKSTTAKAKPSPEKKPEKLRRTRSKRRKQSTSESESGDEAAQASEILKVTEQNAEDASTKGESPEDSHDQVWQVKTAEGSTDGGEIQKLKICLTRPPSTPESGDKSPRGGGKKRHGRTASCSDSTSIEGSDEKKKSKHRSKRSICETSDISEKASSQPPLESVQEANVQSDLVILEKESDADEKHCKETPQQPLTEKLDDDKNVDNSDKGPIPTVADTAETKVISVDASSEENKSTDEDTNKLEENEINTSDKDRAAEGSTDRVISPERKRSISVDKSEVLEIHAEESKGEISEHGITEPLKEEGEESKEGMNTEGIKVSKNEDKPQENVENTKPSQNEILSINETDVVAIAENSSSKVMEAETSADGEKKTLENSESTHTNNEETLQNGHTNIVINRKRRWGSRSNKLSSQKSITISTDVLKEIIPDVKLVEFEEVIEDKKPYKREVTEKVERPVLPKIVIDNTLKMDLKRDKENEQVETIKHKDATVLATNRKISIVKDTDDNAIIRPPSPPRHEQSRVLFITNLVRPFTLSQLKNLLQRTGRISENGFWIDRIKSKCYVIYENEDQAVETRHALHGVTWPVSNPKKLHVDFSTQEEFDKAKENGETDETPISTIPGTVEDWLREQDMKRERGEMEKPWERKSTREWDIGKNEKGKDKEKEKFKRDDKSLEKHRHHTPERSPEPAKKFKKKEEAPAKLLDDLFRKTKTTPCIYWLPLSAETIAIKEEQRRQHMAEHEKRLQELRRTHRRH